MKATQITVTDAQHWGDRWASPHAFEIEATGSTMDGYPNAPITVHLCEGTEPERAAYLLRQIADSLERNGRQWLPDVDERTARSRQGRSVDVIRYQDTDKFDSPAGFDIFRYPKSEIFKGYAPVLSLQVMAGSTPQTVLKMLAEITRFVKSDIKQNGDAAFAAPAPEAAAAGFSDDEGLPF